SQTLQNLIKNQASTYKLSIIYPDGSRKSFSLAEMGMQTNAVATVAGIREDQRQLSSRLEWWRPIPVSLTVSATKQTNSFIDKHASVTIQPAKDATLTLQNGDVQVTNSTIGKHYGLLGPITTLSAAASDLQTDPLHLRTLATRPAISANQIASSKTR